MNPTAPGAGPVTDLRAFLLGSWSVHRTMLDRSTGSLGHFTGVALYTGTSDTGTNDGGLHYREHGTVSWATAGARPFTGSASREYVLRPAAEPADEPGMMDMFFPDGRPFHRMGFADLSHQDRHWCDPDTYRVDYTLIGPDEFRYSWDVTGPAKNLLLESVVRRFPVSSEGLPA